MYFITFLLKNLTRRKVRSLLTVLGVAVAVGTMVTLLGVSHGFEVSFLDTFQHRGADVVVTSAGQVDQLRSDLPAEIGDKIAAIPGVQEVRPGMIEMIDVAQGTTVSSVFVHGWPPDSSLFNAVTVLTGRRLTHDDRRCVMLGETLAANLQKGVGDTLEMQEETFHIVGVFRSFSVFENGGLVIPLSEVQELMGRKGRVTGYTIVLEAPGSSGARTAEEVCHDIEQLRDARGRSYRIAARPSGEYVHGSLPIVLAHGMAWITSAVAAFIGAVSMLNTMLTSVLERTREIGILRAWAGASGG